MSKLQKILAGIVAVCVLFFGFVVVRLGAAPNDNSVKLKEISHENYAHLGKEAYKEAYPLEYNSYMKNNMGGASPTGYGGSDP
ncbi:MAG: ammonia-forming cytochrome c nitrite reductase subunit c552, partial [Selenomonas sp.]|nr:ammonia-forming cytochrome c nitrite reductase subunit c552 [Selenomonas sp.]